MSYSLNINRDLNRKEGNNIPNPYIKALPSLNRIINRNRRKDLLGENLNMSDFTFNTIQQPRITTPQINTPSINTNILTTNTQNISSTLPANFASLPTADKLKTLQDLGIRIG